MIVKNKDTKCINKYILENLHVDEYLESDEEDFDYDD